MYSVNCIIVVAILLWAGLPQVRGEDQVEITVPDNSVFYRKIGTLYPSVNVGHIRLQINLTKVRGITTTICSHPDNLSPYLTFTNSSILNQMIASIKAAFNGLPSEQKDNIPSPMFTMTYRSQLAMLNRFCTQSLESTQLLDEVLGGQPINVRGNRGKRHILTTIAAGLSLLLSGYNTYELQRISSEVDRIEENQHHLVKAVEGLTRVVGRIQSQQQRMSLELRSIAYKTRLRDLETELINLAQTCVSYAEEQLTYQKEIHEGIYDALAQRLSPQLIEPNTMRDALTSIANQAITHGYSTLAQVVLHLFELLVSIFRKRKDKL